MFGSSSTQTIGAITGTSNVIGATLPKAVTAAITRADRIVEGVHKVHPGQGAVTAAVVRALDAGRDVGTDPEVLRAYVGTAIYGVADGLPREVEAQVQDDVAVTCRQHADAIVESWRPAFDAATKAITAAHQRIGAVPLEDTQAILAQGSAAADAWAEANRATKVIGDIVAAWHALSTLTRFVQTDPRFPALRIAEYTPRQWADRLDDIDRKNLTPWQVLLTGGRLDLADGPEYRRRTGAILQAEQKAADARRDAARKGLAYTP